MSMDLDFGRPFLPSFKAVIGSGWGRPRDGHHDHQGIDLWAPVGTPVIAVADGVVYRSYNELRGAAGRYVAIKHDKGWISRYMHLDRATVPVGASVTKGQVIGYSGNTGTASTGPHLHFDLKVPPAMVGFVAAEAGMPTGGFAPNQEGFGVGVPAEPWIPVDEYSSRTASEAKRFGIPLYPERRRTGRAVIAADPLPPIIVGVAAISLLGFLYLRRRRAIAAI